MNEDLQIIAEESRKAMEGFAKDHPQIGSTFDLGCYCAISSYFLCLLARKFGFHLTLVEGCAFEDWTEPNHCWTQYKDTIIDITATQFGCRNKVHVVAIGNKNYKVIRRLTKTRKGFKHDWGNQSPYEYIPYLQKLAERVACEIEA